MDNPPIIPEKKPSGIVNFLSKLGLIDFILIPNKLIIAAKIIDTAMICEIVDKLIFNIRLQPIIIPRINAINIGKNLKEPIPFLICICKILVIKTGTHKSIIAVVGARKKAIIGTENIDIPIPTAPLIMAPKNTDINTTIIISISKKFIKKFIGSENIDQMLVKFVD